MAIEPYSSNLWKTLFQSNKMVNGPNGSEVKEYMGPDSVNYFKSRCDIELVVIEN